MPMFLFRRNVHDISHADDLLIRFRGDDTLAGSDEQHLIAAMNVHFVSGTGAEIDDAKIESCCSSQASAAFVASRDRP